MRYQNGPNAQRGVTLLELMVVAVIIAILAAIAIPSYRQQVLRSNRSDAKVALMQVAQNLERCYTRTGTYTGCIDPPTSMSPEGLYQVTVEIVDEDLGNEYLLTAVPQAGQANDTACGNFTLDQADSRKVTGTSSATPDECWSR